MAGAPQKHDADLALGEVLEGVRGLSFQPGVGARVTGDALTKLEYQFRVNRMITSNLTRVFDLLSLVTPVTIIPKILLHKKNIGHFERHEDVGTQMANQF